MRDNVPDENDRASVAEQIANEELIARVRSVANKPPPADWDRLTCYECGEDLPKERIAANRYLCVHHQELLERKQKGR